MNDSEQLDHFIDRMRSGNSDPHEFAAMERRLLGNPGLRQQYRERMRMESHLISAFQTESAQIVPPLMTAPPRMHTRKRHWIPALAIGIAAALVIGLFLGSKRDMKSPAPVIGHLESSSEAAWTDGGPGGIGAELSAGAMELRSGFAELRLTSGVLVALEAPVRLELIDPMRCRLHHGIAVVDVPDRAEGFIVVTPEGHAVDHGTRFAISVDFQQASADFQVLEGHISVHHASSGAALDLNDRQSARLSKTGIESLKSPPSQQAKLSSEENFLRLQTKGKEASIIRHTVANPEEILLDPDFLMVKRDDWRFSKFPKDRRSLIGFDLDHLDPKQVNAARLRLNMVPTGLGFSSSLPETSTFELYGIRDLPTLEAWPSKNLDWDNTPGSIPNSGEIDETSVSLLASLEIPRGKTSGSVIFSSPDLTDFIRKDTTGQVGFLLVRATPPLDSWSLVHAFAASTHPSAAGPTLELDVESSRKTEAVTR